jgi:EAL domain-containing protein (putative c-di-GMP-specific phosphodiesterase class I)
MEQGINTLEALRDLGCLLALDDFGTGFSSLSYLNRLPIHKLKIDRSFVTGIPHRQSSARITRAILDLTQGLGLHSIAEGIETAEQLAYLRAEGCAEGQGYLFSRPLPLSEFEQWLCGLDHRSGHSHGFS